MTEALRIRGREIEAGDLEQIRCWIAAQPQWSRRRISEELVRLWDWRTPSGQLKDIATRDLLNQLEARGLIVLPARQRRGGRQVPRAVAGDSGQGWLALEPERQVQSASVSELLPLSWHLAQPGEPERAKVARYFQAYHYLGYPDPLGQIHYLVADRQGRDVGCLLFGPASWKVGAREAFVGWSDTQRQNGLRHLANNSRFLLLPGVQVSHLASHILGAAVRRLREDWPAHHGVAVWLVETFVEQGRFSGTCYRAANWLKVGQTQGRTRNDRWHQRRSPIKDVYLLPLVSDFRRRLGVA